MSAYWAQCPLCQETFDASAVVLPAGVCVVPSEANIFGPLCSECTEVLALVGRTLGTEIVLPAALLPPVGDLLPAAADDPHVAWHIDYDVPLNECTLCTTRGGVR